MPFIIYQPKRIRETVTIVLAGVSVVTRRARLPDGSVCMAAQVGRTEPQDRRVLQAARKMGWRQFADDVGITFLDDDPADAPVPKSETVEPVVTAVKDAGMPIVVELALGNGWTAEDLAGSFKGEIPGVRGGHGANGLTMAESSLCTPPPDWKTLRETKWPWECAGWRPPGINFTPPAVTPKVKAAADKPNYHLGEVEDKAALLDPEDPSSIEPGEIADPEAYEQAKAEGRITEIEEPATPDQADEPEDLDDETRALLDEYGRDLQKAVDVASEIARSRGSMPTHSQLNYYLRKHGLKTVARDTFKAILTLL